MERTPASLLQRLRQPGDDDAWKRFVRLYTPLLFYWARKLGQQESDAADLVQEVFTLLVRELPAFTYDRQRSFRGWLRTVLTNKWRELLRRNGRLPRESPGTISVAVPDPAEAYDEAEFNRYLA